ncbi:hypothetical protein MTO96_034085 [Rhipicephalus appendiculatus]
MRLHLPKLRRKAPHHQVAQKHLRLPYQRRQLNHHHPPAAVPPLPAPAPPPAETPTPPLPQPSSAPKQYTAQAADQMPGTYAATALPPIPAGPHPPRGAP